tara:strand:+ start:797 stop:1270 length:474 start_codon:yes stop_codon:yes gene_type:complete
MTTFKFYDTLYDLLRGLSKGRRYHKKTLLEELRRCDNEIIKLKGVQLSKKARKIYNITKIQWGVKKPKSPTEFKGDALWLEHIIAVVKRIDYLIDRFQFNGGMSRKKLDEYIVNTFYAVYKLTKEKEEELDAENLLLEDFREQDKVDYFNETNPIKR